MMEGEPATAGVTRLPDEETSFVGRKVEAPRRRQQRQRAKKKRIAVLGVSVVAMLAFGAVCAFLALPSGPTETMKTAVSQAMESDPASATATRVFIPSFAAYDEDGDGKVSLGEYLDRLAINRDAALKRVDESSLDDAVKTQISDLLNEDFSKHAECVALVAKQDEDTMMTKENFDKVYEEITTGFCPLIDDRIPSEYQFTETAPGKDEFAPTEVDPATVDSSTTSGSDASEPETSASEEAASASGDESASDGSAPPTDEVGWNPDKPTLPPRVIVDDDAKPEEGVGAGEWNPIYPSDPPIPVPSNDPQENAWTPEEPTDPPSAVTADTESEEDSASASQEAPKSNNGVGEDEWNPVFPTEPPSPSSDKDQEQKEFSIGTMLSPEAAAYETPLDEKSPEGEQQGAAYNTYPGAATETGAFTSPETITYGESTGTQSSPETVAYESPFVAGNEQQAGIFNTYTSPKTASYGESTGTQSNPEVPTNESPFAAKSTEDKQAGAYSSAETTTYGEIPSPDTTAYKSPVAEEAPKDEQQVGAYNTYTSAGATTSNEINTGAQSNTAYESPVAEKTRDDQQVGASNTYTSAETTTTQSNPETPAYEQPTVEKAPKDEQQAGAYNAYTGAETTGTQSNPEYKSPIAETGPKPEQAAGPVNSYGETASTQSNPEVAAEKKEAEAPAGTGAYKSDTTTTGATTTYGAPAGQQSTGAYNSYNAYQGYPNNYNKGAANTYTGAGTTYSESNPSGQQPSEATNQGYYSGYTGAANNAGAYNQGHYNGYPGAANNGGGYNAYQGYSGHTGANTNNAGAYSTYTGAGTTTYGGGQQTTGAYNPYNAYNGYNGAGQQTGGAYNAHNAYNGYSGAANAGTYKSYTGAAGTTAYGDKRQLRSVGNPAIKL